MEQLGYQAESGPWRNAYLTAALELRHGNSSASAVQAVTNGDVQKEMTAVMIFEYMGILLDKQALANENFTINFTLMDVGEQHMLQIKNGVILIYEDTLRENADISVTCPKNALLYLLQGNVDALGQAAKIEGDMELLKLFASNLNALGSAGFAGFNIVEP